MAYMIPLVFFGVKRFSNVKSDSGVARRGIQKVKKAT